MKEIWGPLPAGKQTSWVAKREAVQCAPVAVLGVLYDSVPGPVSRTPPPPPPPPRREPREPPTPQHAPMAAPKARLSQGSACSQGGSQSCDLNPQEGADTSRAVPATVADECSSSWCPTSPASLVSACDNDEPFHVSPLTPLDDDNDEPFHVSPLTPLDDAEDGEGAARVS